jgi:hypothetical protein
LLSSSAAALLIGGGTPAAFAACGNNIGAAFDNPLAQTTPCVAVTNTSFTGNITNEGTITPGGITFTNGTDTGVINSSGTIAGGIALDSKSAISASSNAIVISGPSFGGGISSAGTISASKNGILISPGSFTGGVSNVGTISAARNGILVGATNVTAAAITITSFGGGISNSGTISYGGPPAAGIQVGGIAFSGGTISISTFSGGISNSGTITGSGFAGILLVGVAQGSGAAITIGTFNGGINNSRAISTTSGAGIMVGGVGNVTISTFNGGISNSGSIIASSFGIVVGGGTSGAGASVLNFSGGITNTGGIGITGSNGAGIMVSNVSTFLGGISNGGTITLAHFGTGISVNGVAVFSNGVTNSGTISVKTGAGISVTNVATFLGNIFNSGSISVKSGTGIFVCNCATLAGGSIVNTGTIAASSGIVIHNNSPIAILNAGTITGTGGVAIDLTNATGGNTLSIAPTSTIVGNVLGFGNDTFQLAGTGSGAFDLASIGASAQYQGFTTFNVISGTWSVFNVFGQSQPWNVNGGILAGNGTLASVNVNAGGTLEPGLIGVPGTTMTITGNLAFQPGSNYLVNLSPTTASLALVTGSVTLNGAAQGFLAPGSYSAKTTYDILDPTSISGKFTGYASVNAPGFTGTLTYQPNDVLLNLNASLGVGDGLNVNQQNVANAINNFFNNGGTLPADFFPVFGLTGPNLPNALAQLSGEVATGTAAVSNQMMTEFLALMLDPHLDGAGGGAMVPFAPERTSELPPELALAYASALKAPVKKAPVDVQRWTAWGRRLRGHQQDRWRSGHRLQQCCGTHRWFCGWRQLSLLARHGRGLFACRRRHRLEPGAGARYRPKRRVPRRRFWQDLFRPGLYRRRVRICGPLVLHQPHCVRRPVARDLQRPGLCREARSGRSLCGAARHHADRRHTLCCAAGGMVPYAGLWRGRSERRRLRTELHRHGRPRYPRRARRALRRAYDVWRHADDAAQPAGLGARLGEQPGAWSRVPGAARGLLHGERGSAAAGFVHQLIERRSADLVPLVADRQVRQRACQGLADLRRNRHRALPLVKRDKAERLLFESSSRFS